MKKPRIFIAMHYLEIGGAESALIGLLQTLDPARVEVDLFLYSQRGEMMQYIPAWVNVLPEIPAYALLESPVKEALKDGQYRLVAARLLAKFLHASYVRRKKPMDGSAIFGYIGKYVTPVLPSLKKFGRYDLAISFLTPHNIVLNKVDGARKLAWIHTDYTRIDVNAALESPVWGAFDHIVSISPEVTETFCKVFPEHRNRIVEIENILSPAFIHSRAAEVSDAQKEMAGDGLKLLTIGRYSYPKKMEDIPAIVRGLLDRGLNLTWYIIGYGNDGIEAQVRQEIAKHGVEEHVILLGKRTNPYPYIAACDVYVQPSRYEGKSITVREAQILAKPVIVTAYPTAASQVNSGVDGFIVPLELDACIDGIATVLESHTELQEVTNYLVSNDFGNEAEVEKIYAELSANKQ